MVPTRSLAAKPPFTVPADPQHPALELEVGSAMVQNHIKGLLLAELRTELP
jgi:hypothetical protein